jgi:hypothetical protein
VGPPDDIVVLIQEENMLQRRESCVLLVRVICSCLVGMGGREGS